MRLISHIILNVEPRASSLDTPHPADAAPSPGRTAGCGMVYPGRYTRAYGRGLYTHQYHPGSMYRDHHTHPGSMYRDHHTHPGVYTTGTTIPTRVYIPQGAPSYPRRYTTGCTILPTGVLYPPQDPRVYYTHLRTHGEAPWWVYIPLFYT